MDQADQLLAKDVMRRQVRQLSRLINDLLDAHRLERWHVRAELRAINVAEVIEDVCNDYLYLFKAQGIELRVNLPQPTIHALADGDRLGQVISNLLSNCLKFTDRGGLVCVSLLDGPGERELTISVQDTGIGIAPDDLETIFESDVHQASRRNRDGLGLGLPLVRQLVELFGGRVSAHSEGAGFGSAIRIVLPTLNSP
jgi:signal transduction histidine kinase